MKLPIWASMFLNKTLVLANCYNMVVLFSTMVKKCLYNFILFLFCFLTSSWVKGFSIGSLIPSFFETLSKFSWDFGLPTTHYEKKGCFAIGLIT
jgi:hypothetical protein